MTQPSPQQLAQDFPQMFERSAFRLELLDHYVAASEQEPYRRFLAGQPQDPAWRKPWKQLVRAAVATGKTMARVHVVSEPLSDYLRFELTCAYPANVDAGEDVRIIRLAAWPGLWLPDHDYWLFDDARAARLEYNEHGNWTSVDVIRDPGAVRAYCQVRDLAIEHSVPLGAYLRSLGLQEAV